MVQRAVNLFPLLPIKFLFGAIILLISSKRRQKGSVWMQGERLVFPFASNILILVSTKPLKEHVFSTSEKDDNKILSSSVKYILFFIVNSLFFCIFVPPRQHGSRDHIMGLPITLCHYEIPLQILAGLLQHFYRYSWFPDNEILWLLWSSDFSSSGQTLVWIIF